MDEFVACFAHGMKVADGLRLQAKHSRSPKLFQPGIGPHSEEETVRLALAHSGNAELERTGVEVPYPTAPRLSCDIVNNTWAIEVKMFRMKRDNGRREDYSPVENILSPYPDDRSALTDVGKLGASAFACRKGLLIFGYDYDEWPMDPVIEAFEVLASRRVGLKRAKPASVPDLIHPYHQAGRVFGWEIAPPVGR
jgi:hypothetical protein